MMNVQLQYGCFPFFYYQDIPLETPKTTRKNKFDVQVTVHRDKFP